MNNTDDFLTGFDDLDTAGTSQKSFSSDFDFDDIKDDIIKTLESTKQNTLMQDLYTKYDVQIKNQ